LREDERKRPLAVMSKNAVWWNLVTSIIGSRIFREANNSLEAIVALSFRRRHRSPFNSCLGGDMRMPSVMSEQHKAAQKDCRNTQLISRCVPKCKVSI
jgi:gamma-glutamyltranspeptidase